MIVGEWSKGVKNVIVNIYVSVDLSTDNTIEIIRKYQMYESRIKLLKYGERYGGAAKNFFRLIRDVDFFKYDYVAFSDQDDIWLAHAIDPNVGFQLKKI